MGQTDRHFFFIVVLGLGEVNKHAKKILGRSEKQDAGAFNYMSEANTAVVLVTLS